MGRSRPRAARGREGPPGGQEGRGPVNGRISVWPPLPPSAWLRPPRDTLPFPFGEPGCRLYARARHGIWQGVRALGLAEGDEVLAPAYHHGSEIEALLRAGLRCRFYDVGASLGPHEDELEALAGPRTRALYLTHPLGLSVDPPRWRAWCDRKGVVLIEDAAQAWLASWEGRAVGSFGDLAVFCLYKTFGLPDGAAAVSTAALPAPTARPAGGLRVALRRQGAWAAQRWAPVAAARNRQRARRAARQVLPPVDPQADHALGDPATPPSAVSAWLLPRVADPGTAERRRANYRALLERLPGAVPPPFDELPDGASPFAFPVAAPDKDALWRDLAAQGIDALSFWTHPHGTLPDGGFPQAARLRSTVVGLPVHQELRPLDVDRMADAVGKHLGTRAAEAPA